jgi:hypothetical protein
VTIDGILIGNRIHCTLTSRDYNTSNYNVAQITITHTSLLSFLQPPLVVAWLQSSNKGYSSRTYGSRTALPHRRHETVYCSAIGFIVRIQGLQSQSHIMTDGQSASQSWCQAPSGAKDQIFVTSDICGFVDVRTDLSFVAVIVSST